MVLLGNLQMQQHIVGGTNLLVSSKHVQIEAFDDQVKATHLEHVTPLNPLGMCHNIANVPQHCWGLYCLVLSNALARHSMSFG